MAKKYTREALLCSKKFAMYQKDFLAVILKKPEYTMADAVKTVEAFFHEKE